ncbi:MAG: hypothetical protein JW875_01280 [Spirochaetales bacterium]|nr:hypothetical protein [Spirochaetales bacterium]
MNIHNRNRPVAKLALLFLFFAGLFALSCSDEPIFADIEDEVKLKDPSIRGITITSMVSWNGNLYTANGKIYQRQGGTGDWTRMSLPAGTFRCPEIAGDGTALFALFQNSSWNFHSLQMYNGTEWIAIEGLSGVFRVISGSGYVWAFREDLRDNDDNVSFSALRVYANGDIAEVVTGLTSLPVAASASWFATTSAIYDEAGTVISVPAENPTQSIPAGTIRALTFDGTRLFAATDGYVYRWDGSTWVSFAHDTDTPVTSLAWLGAGGKNVLLLSGGSGYSEVLLDGEGNPWQFQNPGDSEASSISVDSQSQYKSNIEDWDLSAIFAIASPVPEGNEYCLYAGVVDSNYDGLWGYYSATQPVWNRE